MITKWINWGKTKKLFLPLLKKKQKQMFEIKKQGHVKSKQSVWESILEKVFKKTFKIMMIYMMFIDYDIYMYTYLSILNS